MSISEVNTTDPSNKSFLVPKNLLLKVPNPPQYLTKSHQQEYYFPYQKKKVEQHRQKYICTTFLSLPKIDTSFLLQKKKQPPKQNPNRNTPKCTHAKGPTDTNMGKTGPRSQLVQPKGTQASWLRFRGHLIFLTMALGRLTLPPTTTPWRTAGGRKGQWLAEVALLAGEGGAEEAG